jgi:hypothetical protein
VSKDNVPEGCTVIGGDDNSFLSWCARNPKGFVMNCAPRGGGIDPYMLHRVVDGRPCYTFDPAEKAHRLTSPDPKVCSMSAEILWRWANSENEKEPPTKCSKCNPQW